MLRLVLTLTLTLSAIALVVAVFVLDPTARATDVMINLGTEVFGIALTVAIVDWLIERNRLRDESHKLAWRLLHEVDQAVWVWQGGRRAFHLDELAALVGMIEEQDPIADFTRELLIRLGSSASDSLRLNSRLFRFEKRLGRAVEFLSGLAQLRELGRNATTSFIVESLDQAIRCLADVTERGIDPNAAGVAKTFRDASLDAQRDRLRGVQHEKGLLVPADLPQASA